ncbi:MAG: lactate permease LctP family transporter [Edaphobacter sp.]|uniref:L-lactate permease n=1 Tax=Edaphobacter sp. TaxID=1934404 RepID=UPI0023A07569|nr:lactate permease LctP family transporter [Edaphobacter sp.]MDE1178181.1 lactate permease LctP family transporter [Edaphobacter sp.]
MTWQQTYLLFGLGPGLSCLLAALPILTMLLLLGVMRKPAWLAGLCGLAVTFALAIGGYHMPAGAAVSAAFYGAAFGLFPICWIIFWAITLFRVTVETGRFEVIKDSIGRLTPDPRLQALLIAFTFAGFLEGASGFGTPVAIASTMLIGLGFSPFAASALCLLANTTPVAFGSIGIPVYTLAGTTGLPLDKLSAAIAAICTPIALIIPAYMILAVGGITSLSGVWVPALLSGVVFGGAQFFIATFIGPALTDLLAALLTLGVLIVYLRLTAPDETEPPIAHVAMLHYFSRRGSDGDGTSLVIEERILPDYPLSEVLRAWMPYAFVVGCVLLWGWEPLQKLLNRATVVLRWPGLHDVVHRMPPIVATEAPYHALFTLNWLAAAGTACMAATLLSVVALGMPFYDFLIVLGSVVRQLRLPVATVSSVLATAFLMNYCGATATLGLAFAATGVLFPFFSVVLGWIGVFLTGSDTSSNALFGNLQVITATRLGFSPVLMAAANSAGGVVGKMISLQTIAVAAASTGLTEAQQVRLFRFTLRHSILLIMVTGGIALAYAYLSHY